ncbi:MAG: hypothetical protein BYD32DRAFT_272989 [Podila humilis]|nr:MAG: hypothetical protein BYD32DRAFT_272989 [Podila humilis]
MLLTQVMHCVLWLSVGGSTWAALIEMGVKAKTSKALGERLFIFFIFLFFYFFFILGVGKDCGCVQVVDIVSVGILIGGWKLLAICNRVGQVVVGSHAHTTLIT